MKLIFSVVCICFILSCKTTRSEKSVEREYEKKERAESDQIYFEEFRVQYLKKLLLYGFNQSEAVKNLIKFDKSYQGEPGILSDYDFRTIDSLAQIVHLRMVTDSINRVGRVVKHIEGKRVFDFILDQIQNKNIEKLIKVKYKPRAN